MKLPQNVTAKTVKYSFRNSGEEKTDNLEEHVNGKQSTGFTFYYDKSKMTQTKDTATIQFFDMDNKPVTDKSTLNTLDGRTDQVIIDFRTKFYIGSATHPTCVVI